METVKIDIDVVNKLRYALDAHIKEANEAVNRLVEREMISGSNDFMMAQYALIAGYYWAMGESELGRAFIKKVKEFSEYAADRTSLIDAYILIGNYETIDDVFDEALTWYFKALDLSL
ncbi:MAG: hypothetical protein JXO44_07635, partial [Clostridia bacterium]|nr:hypothetical protein [Clostridia bacterium]